ncbi:hypothetical protein AAVH_16582 [Aphelenchoides avenae]|nr:hypothetical protein AAVH_16582 [Aphelenchus avenae]
MPKSNDPSYADLCLHFATRYLSVDTKIKAITYVILVACLSTLPEILQLPDDLYVAQKDSLTNLYGVKLGWLWTLIVLGLVLAASITDFCSAVNGFLRVLIATVIWLFVTEGFRHFEESSGNCSNGAYPQRMRCILHGGQWLQGFDTSGHSFILIYSILAKLVCTQYGTTDALELNNNGTTRTSSCQSVASCLACIAALFLHLLWDFELAITSLYYHTLLEKLCGALVAVVCWLLTYKLWYRYAFPRSPERQLERRMDYTVVPGDDAFDHRCPTAPEIKLCELLEYKFIKE